MQIETIQGHEATVVRFTGDFDTVDRGKALAVIGGLLDGGCCRLVFDLERLTFMGSSGVMCILRARSRARAMGGGVVLVRPSRIVRKVLGTMGLESELPCCGSPEEALLYFPARGGAATSGER